MRFVEKLKSDKGVSILLALFLFLVCAAVGSVVLTAGTAAAGRRAQIEAADQRYYSVSSAAELVRDLITESAVTVEFTCEQEDTTKYTLVTDDAGQSRRTGKPTTTEGDPEYTNTLGNLDENNILSAIVKDLIDTTAEDAGFAEEIQYPSTGDPIIVTMSHSQGESGGRDLTSLNAEISFTVKTNGDFDVVIASPGTGDQYKVRQRYQLEVEEDVSEKIEENGTPVISGSEKNHTETYTTTTIKTRKVTFRWKYCDTQTE